MMPSWAAAPTQLPAHLDAVAVGQVQVEQHQVARGGGERGGDGGGVLDLVPAPGQRGDIAAATRRSSSTSRMRTSPPSPVRPLRTLCPAPTQP